MNNAVTFHQNDYIGDSVITSQVASSEVALTLFNSLEVKFSNPGFTFDYWTTVPDGSGTEYTDGEVYNFALGNIDLYAHWIPNQVRFYENAAPSDSVFSVQSASTSTSLTLFSDLNPNFSKPGYVFDGWSTSANGVGTSYADGATYDFTLGSTSLYVQWSAATYSINYAAGGGTASATSATFTSGDSPITLPSASQSGYTFDGWFTSAQGGNLVGMGGDSFTPTSSVTLYAQWSTVTYSVNYAAGGGTAPIASASFTPGGTALTLPTPTQPGYTFDGWFTSAQGGNLVGIGGDSFTPTSSVTLYAQWSAATYSVNYAADGGTAVATSVTFTTGSSPITLPSASQPGYTFDGWFTSAQGGNLVGTGGNPFTPTSSATLYAQWSADTYSVNYVAGGGTAGATSATFTTGSSPITLPSASQPGYTFDGWFTSAQGGNLVGTGGSSFTPTSSMMLYAQWSATTFSVSYAADGGTMSPSSASFTTGGAPLTLPTPTQPGFTFHGWFTAPQGGSLVGTGGGLYTPISATTLFAQWTAIPSFNITFSANGGVGSVGSVSAVSGTALSLPSPSPISRPGYVFTGWNTVADGSGTAVESGSSMVLSGPTTLYAQWRQLPAASVTFVLNGARGSVSAIAAYDGAVETLPSPPALARPGYIFTGWNTRANGTGSMFAGGAAMTLGASLTLYAQWSGHAPARLVSPIGPFATAHVGVVGSLVAQVDRLASLIIRQQRHVVTLYGYPSTAATAQAGISEGRARVASVAAALRRALTHAHHGGVRVVVVDEGLAVGASNRVSVVVR